MSKGRITRENDIRHEELISVGFEAAKRIVVIAVFSAALGRVFSPTVGGLALTVLWAVNYYWVWLKLSILNDNYDKGPVLPKSHLRRLAVNFLIIVVTGFLAVAVLQALFALEANLSPVSFSLPKSGSS